MSPSSCDLEASSPCTSQCRLHGEGVSVADFRAVSVYSAEKEKSSHDEEESNIGAEESNIKIGVMSYWWDVASKSLSNQD